MDVAVVTGAARGIGKAIAFQLVGQGWHVVAVDFDESQLVKLKASLFHNVTTISGDVAVESTARLAREQGEATGNLAAWVNNAAVPGLGALHELDPTSLRRTVDVNLIGVMLGCQQALQSFVTAGVAGSIVNISSIHARASFPNFAIYDACKGGVESLTRYVCVEYAHLGIRCNAVAPGVVETDFITRNESAAPDAPVTPTLNEYSPAGRSIPPSQIASAVAFLASDSARFVNGHVLSVDGGMAARCLSLPSTASTLTDRAPSA